MADTGCDPGALPRTTKQRTEDEGTSAKMHRGQYCGEKYTHASQHVDGAWAGEAPDGLARRGRVRQPVKIKRT